MLKKTCLIFVFLTLQTTFYGFNADFSTSSEAGITLEEKMEARYVISPYDHVIRNISEREGNDWRLMSAIAYHESRFKADIVSRRGARGLMQIMPAVARQPRKKPCSIRKPMYCWPIKCGIGSIRRSTCRREFPRKTE